MKSIIWILLATALFFGCKPGVPADIVSPDKMEKVLYDIHLADGYISTIPTVDSTKKVGAAYYNGIYKKFGIDSAVYNKSMDYYYDHPEKLSLMYKTIATDIKNQISSIQKSDSIKNDKILKIQRIAVERVSDSLAINQPYDINYAARGLYLERYNDLYSKNGIVFSFLNLKNDKTPPKKPISKPADKLKIETDSLALDKKKLKLETKVLPMQARPMEKR